MDFTIDKYVATESNSQRVRAPSKKVVDNSGSTVLHSKFLPVDLY